MSVDRRVDTDNRVLFPIGMSIEDSLVGHLEFGLRREGVPGTLCRGMSSPL
jgi:hypothetical protein